MVADPRRIESSLKLVTARFSIAMFLDPDSAT